MTWSLCSTVDVSQVVERLADVLGVDRPLSLLEDTSLAMTTSDLELPTPVDSSTPATAHSSLVAQIARLQEEVSQVILYSCFLQEGEPPKLKDRKL